MPDSDYYLNQNIPLTFNERLEKYCHLMRSASKLYHSNPLNEPMLSLNISEDDVPDVLQRLNEHKVKFLLVGGMTVMFHGYIRTTRIWTSG